jgi:ribosomal protein S18 acetylase RimI-like enzyme
MNIGNGDPAFKIHIREYTPDDLDACLAIYASNQDVLPLSPYILEEFLMQGTSWFLVAEVEGNVVGCGGIEISAGTNETSFVFGMVERSQQRQGIGSILALTRLTLVPIEGLRTLVNMMTEVVTESFYSRFGFERIRPDAQRAFDFGMYVHLGQWMTVKRKNEIRAILASYPVTFAESISIR